MNKLKLLDIHNDKTCIILNNDEIVFTSDKKGVAPILDFYHSNKDVYENLIIVDRIVGKGALLLALLVNAKEVYTPVISENALKLNEHFNIKLFYEKTVPYIINRNKDGMCPIEKSLLEINDLDLGYQTIINTLRKLSQK